MRRIQRRHFLAGVGALAAPSVIAAPGSRVLRYATSAGVVQLDPMATTIYSTLILGLQVFKSLYCVDEHLMPRPQMAAGHVVEDDGKRWIITLRDGLRFHDGEPVLARDCVASINRWMKRDVIGRTIAKRLDALEVARRSDCGVSSQPTLPPTAVRTWQDNAKPDGSHAVATCRD